MTDPTHGATAPMPQPKLDGPKMRASDAERHAIVLVLQDAIGRGLLTPTEGGERMSAAFAAAFVPDHAPLTADLPKSPGKATPIGWKPLLLMVLEQLQSCLRTATTGPRRPAQLGAALLLVLLLLTCGLAFAHLVLDNGGGPGQRGFGRR